MGWNQNAPVRVKSTHTRFPNRVGFFQFQGEGPSCGVSVCTDKPILGQSESGTWFAVECEDLELVT